MEIFIWRHGKAESMSQSGRDADRRLTPQGTDGILKLARHLKSRNEAAGMIFTSPYLRARETSERIQEILQCPGGVELMPQLASATPTRYLVNALKKINDIKSFILVGHMPDLGMLSDYFLGRRGVEKTSLSAGEVVKISISNPGEAGQGNMIFQISPEDLKD